MSVAYKSLRFVNQDFQMDCVCMFLDIWSIFYVGCSMWEKSINYFMSTQVWSFSYQNKCFISLQTSSFSFKHLTLLFVSFFVRDVVLWVYFFKRTPNLGQGVSYYWKDFSNYYHHQNLQKKSFAGTQKLLNSSEFRKIFG